MKGGWMWGGRREYNHAFVSNAGYYRSGTTDTGAMAYTWDAKGNMLTQTGQTYEWNEDNRLTKVRVSGGDPKAELFQKFFKYDYAGRRIMEYKNTDGVRTRSFFNGLTEEIKKVSVGTGADTSFARVVKLDAEAADTSWSKWGSDTTHVWDADRYSNVIKETDEDAHGVPFWASSGSGWNITGKRTFSMWMKSNRGDGRMTICVKATDGNYYGLGYQLSSGPAYSLVSPNWAIFHLDQYASNVWKRIERDLQGDMTAAWPGKTLDKITGVYVWCGGSGSGVATTYWDDLAFSNSLTIEHNTIGFEVAGHILRHTEMNSSSYAQSHRWFHYDQVGSVMTESDASGALAQTHYQDAFGNTQASWSSGLWGGDTDGWHHNTM